MIRAELGRVLRFGLVGGGATLVHVGTAMLAVEAGGLAPEAATTVGLTAAMGVSYFGHQLFSFAVRSDHKSYLPRFIVATVVSYLLNVGLIALFTRGLALPYQLGLGVVAVAIPLANYLMGRLWVFERGLRAEG